MCSSMYEAFSGKKVTRCPRIMRGSSTSQIPIPEAVKDCNKHMGGVDLSDALIRYYNVLYKKTKWYNTFFFFFFLPLPGFILHQQLAKEQGKTPLTQKAFREALVSEMANAATPESSTSGATEHPPLEMFRMKNAIQIFFFQSGWNICKKKVCLVQPGWKRGQNTCVLHKLSGSFVLCGFTELLQEVEH